MCTLGRTSATDVREAKRGGMGHTFDAGSSASIYRHGLRQACTIRLIGARSIPCIWNIKTASGSCCSPFGRASTTVAGGAKKRAERDHTERSRWRTSTKNRKTAGRPTLPKQTRWNPSSSTRERTNLVFEIKNHPLALSPFDTAKTTPG